MDSLCFSLSTTRSWERSYGGDPSDAIESITDLVWNKLDHPELNGYFSLV